MGPEAMSTRLEFLHARCQTAFPEVAMSDSRTADRDMLLAHPPEKLMEIFFTHIRNVFRVDGLYFLGIEEKYSTEAATAIDAGCHKALGQIEAKVLPKVLELTGRGIPVLIETLKHSCWSLDLQDKTYQIEQDRAVLTVVACATQLTRQKKGLPIFPCKQVRQGYLEAFTRAFNPELTCTCLFCPPEERQEGAWCRWEFTSKK
jgi:hypothetical protein